MNDPDGTWNSKGKLGKLILAGPYAMQAGREIVMAKEVHHKDSVRERERRERHARYDMAKQELARARAASGRGDRLSP